ncbi:MAG: single-stranded DNA-binding protein [Waddliaceae bacterium]|jgi:single-strand DNA-binding protein|nr:single-stranded DNA-binding protein [Waddliaceae bacterium]MBT4444466.1 single-stranded DNA-binding protein [Waddliaceae bacterium]MBT6928935.1 single-stranded DNA-binding protein [Waddliaceae bacterium]MBT7264182.1 single-stranded DNA-binding protein [Waddliaceae bacterium]MBT7461999.1 single-stranded DNA-binding protein [Waddliaceae bacterium]
MNILQIAGRLGADPESRFTSSGQKVTTLRVACNVRKGGNEDTMWWRVTIWGDRFDKLVSYLKKGSAIIVTGTMQKPDVYQDRNGDWKPSLDMTAEMISFSPFGRSDKSDENADTASKDASVEETKGNDEQAAAPAATDDNLPF